MGDVDPWLHNLEVACQATAQSTELKFEDNFVKPRYKKLRDSEQYLATLERKLSKLKTSGNKLNEKDRFIKEIETIRTSCMFRLITSGSREDLHINQDLELDTPANSSSLNWIKYQLNPEKPITTGELQELLKSDILSETFHALNEQIETSKR